MGAARTPKHAQVVNDVGLPSLPPSVTRTLRVPVACEPSQFACDSDVCRDGEWWSTEQGRFLGAGAHGACTLHTPACSWLLSFHSQAVMWCGCGGGGLWVVSPWLGAPYGKQSEGLIIGQSMARSNGNASTQALTLPHSPRNIAVEDQCPGASTTTIDEPDPAPTIALLEVPGVKEAASGCWPHLGRPVACLQPGCYLFGTRTNTKFTIHLQGWPQALYGYKLPYTQPTQGLKMVPQL